MLEYGDAFNEQNDEAIKRLESKMGAAAARVLWEATDVPAEPELEDEPALAA